MAAARRDLHDHHFREAKRLGYVARSALKLEEILEKRPLVPRGGHVLDLGCAPGAWLQVACRAIGPPKAGGRVVGIDVQPTQRPSRHADDRVEILVGDAFEIAPDRLREAIAPATRYDAVLSDMMAATTGNHHADHHASIRLADRALDLALELLRPGGAFVVKVFEGEAYADYLERCRTCFARVKGMKPKASRAVSTEMFVVAEDFTPPADDA